MRDSAAVCRWVSNLSRFLQHVVGQLGRRLTLENSPKDQEDGSDSESDDGSEAPMSGQGDEQVLIHEHQGNHSTWHVFLQRAKLHNMRVYPECCSEGSQSSQLSGSWRMPGHGFVCVAHLVSPQPCYIGTGGVGGWRRGGG